MPSRERPSYYLYGQGFDTDVLRIGHLVFGPYQKPILSKHCNNIQLSDSDLERLATTYPVSGTFTSREGRTPSILFDLASIANLNIAFPKSFDIDLTAAKGKRVEIKEPESFFKEVVGNEPGTLDQLALWLSAAKSKRMQRLYRKPQIWLLTGCLQFQDVNVTVCDSNNPSFSAGLSTDALAASGIASLGATGTLASEASSSSVQHIDRELVWAARYHLLDVGFTPSKSAGPGERDASLGITLGLYPDITSKGQIRTGDDTLQAVITLAASAGESDTSDPTLTNDSEYWTTLYLTIKDFESLRDDSDED